METAPVTGEEVSEETSSTEEPDELEFSASLPSPQTVEMFEEDAEDISPQDREEFDRRVDKLCQMMEDDPTVMPRLIAETYVNIASAEMGIRQIAETIQKQGLAGMMKGAFKRGG